MVVFLIILLTLYSLRRLWIVWAEILNFDGVGDISILLCSVPRYFLARYYNSTFRRAAPEAGTFLFSGFYILSRSNEERDEKDIKREETTTTIIQTIKLPQRTLTTIKFLPEKTDISSRKRAVAAVSSLILKTAGQRFPSLTKLFRVKMSLIAPVLLRLFKVETGEKISSNDQKLFQLLDNIVFCFLQT